MDRPSIPSKEGSFDRLANLLRVHQDTIVHDWMTRVANTVASHSIDAEELENAIREFLDHVATQLARGDHERAPSAAEHGEQRYRIGFHLAAMTKEYGLLLQSVEKLVTLQGIELTMGEFGALTRHIVSGITEAVTSYVDEQQRARAEQASRHFGFIAHELRNPLQSMTLALDAWRDAEQPVPRVRRTIARSVETMRELIDGTLVDVQSDARGLVNTVPRPARFDMASLLRDIAEANEAHGAARSIELTIEAPERMEVELDARLIRSVLTNLIRNGIKFSASGGTVTARLRETDEERVVFEVEDTCGGLPTGAAETMFTPFTQMGEDRSGFGLGLAITRQAVEAQHGRIQVHDVEGHGCVFVVNLPKVVVPD